MEFMPVNMKGQSFSPTIASRVRPGGALAFSEPMKFDAMRGGWVSKSQLEGYSSPGRPASPTELNGNLKASAPPPPPVEMSAEALLASKIKLNPTQSKIDATASKNPFAMAYVDTWQGQPGERGWYDKADCPYDKARL